MDRYLAGAGARWLWLVLMILAAIMAGATLYTVIAAIKDPPVCRPPPTGIAPSDAGPYRPAHLQPTADMVWFLASRLLVFMAFTTIQQFALYFLQDVIGVANPAEATARFSIFAVVGMLVAVWPAGLSLG